ncbi:hypothetical protein ACIBFB_07135 [Nocardiopsis sp. NPDC050513]|uniref:hypothetical protein n=1 Tax=Nocardiopsis sp. NPDC050513 TaxID=3364338 RepID=UPI00378E803D
MAEPNSAEPAHGLRVGWFFPRTRLRREVERRIQQIGVERLAAGDILEMYTRYNRSRDGLNGVLRAAYERGERTATAAHQAYVKALDERAADLGSATDPVRGPVTGERLSTALRTDVEKADAARRTFDAAMGAAHDEVMPGSRNTRTWSQPAEVRTTPPVTPPTPQELKNRPISLAKPPPRTARIEPAARRETPQRRRGRGRGA